MGDREDDLGVDAEEEGRPSRAAHTAQDDLSELVDPEVVDADEQEEDDMFELDQEELDELGLTLDDPHQPGRGSRSSRRVDSAALREAWVLVSRAGPLPLVGRRGELHPPLEGEDTDAREATSDVDEI